MPWPDKGMLEAAAMIFCFSGKNHELLAKLANCTSLLRYSEVGLAVND
jgi:hypothetical protein